MTYQTDDTRMTREEHMRDQHAPSPLVLSLKGGKRLQPSTGEPRASGRRKAAESVTATAEDGAAGEEVMPSADELLPRR